MKNFALILAAAGLALGLTSCETTGDPRQGGLFGWSDDKAQGRLNERYYAADQIDADTNRINRQNRNLEGTRDRLRKQAY